MMKGQGQMRTDRSSSHVCWSSEDQKNAESREQERKTTTRTETRRDKTRRDERHYPQTHTDTDKKIQTHVKHTQTHMHTQKTKQTLNMDTYNIQKQTHTHTPIAHGSGQLQRLALYRFAVCSRAASLRPDHLEYSPRRRSPHLPTPHCARRIASPHTLHFCE